MSRIFITWELGGGLGHVSTIRPIAGELADRGHEPVVAARNVRSASRVITDPRVRIVQCPLPTWPHGRRFHPPATYAHLLYSIGFNEAAGLASLIRAWRSLYELVDPGFILVDHSPTALLSLGETGPPRAGIGVGFSMPPETEPLPVIRHNNRSPESHLADEREILRLTNEALKRAGRLPIGRLADLFTHAGTRFLTTYPALDHFGPRTGVRYHGVFSSLPGKNVEWPAGSPRVFFYLVRSPSIEATLSELASMGWSCIVHGTWVDQSVKERFKGTSVAVSSDPIDMKSIVGCDLAVLNAGHGSTARMLCAGVPVLQLPVVVEQAITAQLTAELGAGLVLVEPDPSGLIGAMVKMVCDQSYRRAAESFAADARERYGTDPAGEIADEIESLMA